MKGGKNNPGNIRNTSIKWGGEITQPGDVFESFDTLKNGVKAMYQNLLAFKNVHAINTISGIIYRWAPPNENDTSAYINFVSEQTGIDQNKQLSIDDYPAIISAMSKQEGRIPLDVSEVNTFLA